MKKKVIIVLIGFFLVQFISSCCKHVKYYDFSEMDVQLSSNFIEQGESLTIDLSATDVEYLSLNLSDCGFPSALALSCDDGWGGMKYPLTKINITSYSNFNIEYPANENLAPLFKVKKFIGNGEFEFVNITEQVLEETRGDFIQLMLTETPMENLTHQFQLKLTKSNDEEIMVETDNITWQ